jgi:hypothetical protein
MCKGASGFETVCAVDIDTSVHILFLENKMTWMVTKSGKKFDVAAEFPAFDLTDIAYGLSRECRFAGQTNLFFSVAQHSMCVAQLVEPKFKLEALLHDGTEAYLRDIPTPIKNILPDYLRLERELDVKLRKYFELPETMSQEVQDADRAVLEIERSLFIPDHPEWPKTRILKLDQVPQFIPLPEKVVRTEFLKRIYSAIIKTVNV